MVHRAAPGRSGNAPGVEVVVNTGHFDEVGPDFIERAVRHALDGAWKGEGELSVTLLADADIRRLNEEYLGQDVPTDVIAFSLGDATHLIGDVYIGFDQAVRQSAEYGVALSEEVVRLAIHGTLHVLGHDHPEGADRIESPMFLLQERLLREFLDGP